MADTKLTGLPELEVPTLDALLYVVDDPSGTPTSKKITISNMLGKLIITNVDDTYVVLDTDEWIRCDGTFTVTLPPATGSGQGFLIMNIGVGTITVDGDGTDTINGELTQTVLALDSLFVLDAAAGIWDAR
jgi:hypothetical protein